MCSSSATAWVVFFARSSNAPAQPTQNSYSTSASVSTSAPTCLTSKGRSLAQSIRPDGFMFHGLPLFSRPLNSPLSSDGNVRLDQHLVAAHVHDVVDVLDVDRALLHARAARRTRPQHVRVDRPRQSAGADQRLVLLGEHAARAATCASSSARQQVRRLGVRVLAQVHHQQLGRQRLLGVPGRALGLAAAALGAGGEVEQALPGEVLDLADAEGGVLVQLLDVLEVDRLAARP